MKILVTNDDGIYAKGVHKLIDRLQKFGDVVCVCPDAPRSGQSMAMTFENPLRLTRLDDYHGAKMYKVNGTPVDCVKLALHAVMDRVPDLVVAGINHGSNAAVNVIYSGTMGAAFEACAWGIPAVGFSLTTHDPDADFEPCMPYVDEVINHIIDKGLPDGVCLNVNIPAQCIPLGLKWTRAAKGKWTDEYKRYDDPMGRPFYMLMGHFVNAEPDNHDTDEWLLDHGYATVVPCALDRTANIG